AGMGISLVPRSVLATFPERKRLSTHALPRGQDRALTALFWRKGADSPKIAALRAILEPTKRKNP
ncbi:MAG: LysR substrate-binding domain-containing protein, partial [Candidatus Eiseniibacteriota bacterium]